MSETHADELSTSDLCRLLAEDEEAPQPPRAEWWKADEAPQAAKRYLASVLKEFGVKPLTLGTGNRAPTRIREVSSFRRVAENARAGAGASARARR
jgi:hypothetical protein